MARGGNGQGGGKSGGQLGRLPGGSAGRSAYMNAKHPGSNAGRNTPAGLGGDKLPNGDGTAVNAGTMRGGGPRVAPRKGSLSGSDDPQSRGGDASY